MQLQGLDLVTTAIRRLQYRECQKIDDANHYGLTEAYRLLGIWFRRRMWLIHEFRGSYMIDRLGNDSDVDASAVMD